MADDKKDDRPLTEREWRDANFVEALRRMPLPVLMYDNAIICPWCGAPHTSANLTSLNECEECRRSYCFGYPPWDCESDRPMTWVGFPHVAFAELGSKASLLEDWKPNERLQEIYKYWSEREKSQDISKRATHSHGDTLQ